MANKTLTIRDVKVQWARIHTADDNGKYSVQAILTQDQYTRLKKVAQDVAPGKKLSGFLPPQTDADVAGTEYTADKQYRLRLTTAKPPKPVNAALKPFKGAIGNGSTCSLMVAFVEYKQQAGGVSSYLNGIQVTDLVEFGEQFEVVKGGFTGEGEAPAESVDEFQVVDASAQEANNEDW